MSGRVPGRPKRISEAVEKFLAQSGIAERVAQAQVIPEWAELVGPEIARVSEPQAVSADGILFVAVRSHGWMSELSLLEPQVIAALNRVAGRPPIRRIHWRLKRD